MRTGINSFIVLTFVMRIFAQEPAIDKAVADILVKSGAPSASIAIVRDGKITYVHTYGNSRLDPPLAAGRVPNESGRPLSPVRPTDAVGTRIWNSL